MNIKRGKVSMADRLSGTTIDHECEPVVAELRALTPLGDELRQAYAEPAAVAVFWWAELQPAL